MNEQSTKSKRATLAQLGVVERFARAARAAEILGGRQVVRDCESGGWLSPVHRRHKLTLFSIAHLHSCADRIEAGEYPFATKTQSITQ